MQYPWQKGARNSLLSPWASWTFGPGKARARRATCLLPPSLGHGSRKQAGSRLRVGPTFPTRWRELLSENGGRCILLIKAFSKFPSSPRKEGGGSHRAIVKLPAALRDSTEPPGPTACLEENLRGPRVTQVGIAVYQVAKSDLIFKHLFFLCIKLSSHSTLKLGQPAQQEL